MDGVIAALASLLVGHSERKFAWEKEGGRWEKNDGGKVAWHDISRRMEL